MCIKINKMVNLSSFFLFFTELVFAAKEVDEQIAEAVMSNPVNNWSLGLLVAICLFFVCVWFVKKMGGFSPAHSKDTMKVVAGLSLGGREKILLVQLGEKQLVLGVAPGKINNLLVLEGEDRVFQEKNISINEEAESNFSQKLEQIVKGSLKG